MVKSALSGSFFRQHMISIVMALLLFTTAHFFLAGYDRYVTVREKVEILTWKAGVLKQQKTDVDRKRRILSRVGNFINKGVSLGLEKNKWAVYDVNIEEPFTFPELEHLLGQCTNSSSYYFKPAKFHVKLPPSHPPDSPSNKGGDMLLTLKGTFLVRHR
jgi:hypothetical protein